MNATAGQVAAEELAAMPSAELCARLARALDAAMEDADYVYGDSVRWLIVEAIEE